MLGAVLIHPERREVIPLAPEPIVKGDGTTGWISLKFPTFITARFIKYAVCHWR